MNGDAICFIPIRSGSKTIPDKNIKELGGKPLVAWSIESALKTELRVIVDSDSREYLKIAEEYGAEGLLRPVCLAEDNSSMFLVLKNQIQKIEPVPEIVVLLSATTPFRKIVVLKSAISFFMANIDKYDSLMTVQKIPDEHNPAQVIVKTLTGLKMADGRSISRRINGRQRYPEAYITSQGIYIFKTENLKEGNFYGKKTMLLECDKSIDINTEEDFKKCEEHLAQKHG